MYHLFPIFSTIEVNMCVKKGLYHLLLRLVFRLEARNARLEAQTHYTSLSSVRLRLVKRRLEQAQGSDKLGSLQPYYLWYST